MKLRLLPIFLFLLANLSSTAQTPFVCDGSFYLTTSGGGNGQLHTVTIDNVTGNVTFTASTNTTGVNINATGYRITDNYIYGMHPTQEDLYRIDATGNATFLANLANIPTNLSYFSGDVTPSGDTLVLIGRSGGQNGSDQTMIFVDLTSPTYTQTQMTLTQLSTGGPTTTRVADISFDPITGICYAYDANANRLVTISTTTGVIDDVTFPTVTGIDLLGAFFFDPFGNLFSYGRSAGATSQTDMFVIDKTTGNIVFLTSGPVAGGTDGCSCPYTIKVRKTVSKDTVAPCERFVFDFEIINTSGGPQNGIDFQDIMPGDVTVTQVLNNPYGGTVTGIGTSSLNIAGMNIPLGVDTLSVEVQASSIASGNYTNQAVIFNLPAALGGSTASDNPFTSFVDDPTPFTVVPTLQAFAFGDTTVCPGANAVLGAAGLGGAGGPYTYSWDPVSNISTNPNIQNPTVSNLTTTTYTVSVTDANGCTETATVDVNIAFLDIDIGPDTLICKNDSLILDATFAPLDGVNYFWHDGSTGPIYVAHGAGTYWVTAMDACGNTDSDTIVVTETLVEVSSFMSSTPTLCFGSNEGTTSVVAGGGDPPYTYLWSDSLGQTTTTITNLVAGLYTVTITDSLTCRNINTIQVMEPPLIVPQAAFVDSADCFAHPSGTAQVTPIGGVGGYTYLWSDTVQTQTGTLATNLIGGDTYTVAVTDTNNCTIVDTVTIPAPLPLNVGAFSPGTRCFEQNDGNAFASSVGGTMPYNYLWDINGGVQTGDTARNLFAGNYFVTVTDVNGCTDSTFVIVQDALPLVFDYDVTPVRCQGESNGAAEVNMLTGEAPFVFTWGNGVVDTMITDLTVGTYTVTVTDANGCFQGDSVLVPEPVTFLQADLEVENISCNGLTDGSLEINAFGGNPQYFYSFDSVEFNNRHSIFGLDTGSYTVYLLDSKGCTGKETFTITEPVALELDAGGDRLINYGDTVNLFALHNSLEVVTYEWTTQFGTDSIVCADCATAIVSPGSDTKYFITVRTEKGCEIVDFVTVLVRKPRNIYIPNAFSPNEDGTNDVFYIHSKEPLKVNTFKVYDRWGELIYQTTDQQANDPTWGWDGTFNGNRLNSGLFIWVAEIEYIDGVTETKKGEVTIVK